MPSTCTGITDCVRFTWRRPANQFRYAGGAWNARTISACFPGTRTIAAGPRGRLSASPVTPRDRAVRCRVHPERPRRHGLRAAAGRHVQVRRSTGERRPAGRAGRGLASSWRPAASGSSSAPRHSGSTSRRWYVDRQQAQTAADAAATAGVPYLPYDLPTPRPGPRRWRSATVRRRRRQRRGHGRAGCEVRVSCGWTSPAGSTTCSAMMGVGSATITRTAVADYKGAAPMGSPCNTFGNEPPAGTSVDQGPFVQARRELRGAAGDPPSTTAVRAATVLGDGRGAADRKGQRRPLPEPSARLPAMSPCNSAGPGTPYRQRRVRRPFGYFFVVKVEPAAVNPPSTCRSTTRVREDGAVLRRPADVQQHPRQTT